MKPKLHILVRQATHFLRWELPLFARHFELVDQPANDVILFAFGPDVLDLGAQLPSRRRVAMLFPGFSVNPYHDLTYRRHVLDVIDGAYDLCFVNPGPLEVAFKASSKVRLCAFSVDPSLVRLKRYRQRLDSLVHVSADCPHKDWERSGAVMRLTGLKHEVFPQRGKDLTNGSHQLKRFINRVAKKLELSLRFNLPPPGYVDHRAVVKKYQSYDGFVHVAAELVSERFIDGKYTACLIEAGLTGSILFWHDTFGLGNTLETVFALPKEPPAAAARILEIRKDLDVSRHSRLTRDEMMDRFNPEASVTSRARAIKTLLD